MEKAFFDVGGMTCSACSNTIEGALKNCEGVKSCSVSLMTEKAEVIYDPLVVSPAQLLEEIEDVGFDASMANSDDRPPSSSPSAAIDMDVLKERRSVKVFLQIGGMTCSACSNTIENTLNSLEGVHLASVSLMLEKAEVLLDPMLLTAAQVAEEVEDVGFDASVIDSDALGCRKMVISITPGISDDDVVAITALALASPGVLDVRAASELSQCMLSVWFAVHTPSPSASQDMTPSVGGVRDVVKLIRKTVKSKLLDVNVVDGGAGDMAARKRDFAEQRRKELKKWKRAFWTSMMFTVPVFFLSMVCPMVPAIITPLQAPLFGIQGFSPHVLLLWGLCTPVQFGMGWRFYVAAYKSVKHGAASMDVLVALGSTSAYAYSITSVIVCVTSSHTLGRVFFDTSAMLITVILLGRYIENIAKGKTSEALSALMSLQPTTALLLEEDDDGVLQEHELDVHLVQHGDILLVKKGCKFPVDGILTKGETSVDEALLTGEAMPVAKRPGDTVIGATINQDAPVQFRVTGVGAQTALAKIVSLVNQAQTGKAPVQAFADKVAGVFVPAVLLVSLLTFLVWFALLSFDVVPDDWKTEGTGDFLFAFMFAVAVLVISCPCSLGLATPTAVMVGTGVGAKLGILFKGGEPLELTGKVKAVMFDKTGTLTLGVPAISSESVLFHEALAVKELSLWSWFGAVETQGNHVLATAISAHARRLLGHSLPAVDNFETKAGAGVKGVVDGRTVALGNLLWMEAHDVDITEEQLDIMGSIQDQGHVAIVGAVDGKVGAIIALEDPLKPEAIFAVQRLQSDGIEVFMVTGDNRRTAHTIGLRLGLHPDNVIAEVSPGDKSAEVQRVQAELQTASTNQNGTGSGEGERELLATSDKQSDDVTTQVPLGDRALVMFVGDGVNDSPALAQADVGVAIGSGTDIAVETASVVLMHNELTAVLTAIDLSKATLARIRWNFRWAIVYNIVAIPIAAGVFYPLVHMTLPPVVAAMAMGCSSVSVILSSLWLKRYRPPVLTGFHGYERTLSDKPNKMRDRRGPGPSYTSVAVSGGDDDDVEDIELL